MECGSVGAVHTLEIAAMFKLMSVGQHDPAVGGSLGQNWSPPKLTPLPIDRRTEERRRKGPEFSGRRQLLPSSLPSACLHAQLDSLLHACWLPGRGVVQRVWMFADLPPCLEQRARSISSDAIWRAYTDGVRLWFAVAAAAEPSYGRHSIALEVLFFENDGAVCSGGLWSCQAGGDWRLERLVDMSTTGRVD